MNDKNNKNEALYFYDKVEADEMQKTLSFELEHKSLWLWYILNSVAMLLLMLFINRRKHECRRQCR